MENYRHMVRVCVECDEDLTQEEVAFFDGRCEACEIAWQSRVELWRRGGDDPELSAMFGGGPEGHA